MINGQVTVGLWKSGNVVISSPTIRNHSSSWPNILSNETKKGRSVPTFDDRQETSTRTSLDAPKQPDMPTESTASIILGFENACFIDFDDSPRPSNGGWMLTEVKTTNLAEIFLKADDRMRSCSDFSLFVL